MRRARGSTSDQEQPGRRQRRRVVQEPAGQAAPRGRQHRGARVAPAAAAAPGGGAAAAPSRRRGGPPPQHQQHESDDAQEQYSNEEQEPEQTSDYDEGEESQPEETTEERRIGRQLLRDLGAASSDTDHTDDDEEHDSDDDSDDGDEFDDRNPDEDEFAEEEDEDVDDGGDIDHGEGFVIFGGDDYDIVVGGPPHHPVRSTGIIPNVNPTTDTQITPGVYARQEPDGKHCLFGAPLRHVPKLLERILQMRQQQGQLLWKSSIVLGQREWGFIKEVLGHERIQPLLQRGERVLKPLPDAGFPQALRPRDSSGTPLQGPKVTRNGKPWNVGRQYFSSFKSGDMSSFLWADGVGGFEAEAQESFSDYMFGF